MSGDSGKAQFDTLLVTASGQKRAPYLADLIIVAVMTGCRKGELLGLEWSRVDLAANVIVLRGSDTKAGKSRLVPINEAAKDALLRRLQFRQKHCPEASSVFCGPDGKRMVAVLGHSTVRMTERYAHLAPANARDAVEKLVVGPKPIPSAAEEEVATA